jgi:PKD repeat protein
MRKRLKMACLAEMLIFALTTFIPVPRVASALQTSGALRIDGLVNRPLNLTYAELLSFPMVSEVAELKCVDGFPDVTYNWTGIPLFYLLTLAQINSEAYKVVTYGSDGYSSDLLVEDALKPTTILALGANGTSQPDISGSPTGLYRLVVPNNWGYKWVSAVDEIEAVNYNYKGYWENSGYADNATRSDSTALPSITPPVQELNFALGNLTFNAEAFTDVSISSYMLDYSQKQVSLNVSLPSGIGGFADFILPQDFLKSPYSVTVDNQTIDIIEADLTNQSYLYTSIPEGFHVVKIVGTGIFGFAPEIKVSVNQIINVGETAVFDANKSAAYGTIVSYEWRFGDGENGTGAVVSHSYSKEGIYQLELNETDNYGLSSSETLTITVGSGPEYIPIAVKVILAAVLGLLILMFAVLVRGRRKERVPKQ